MPANRKISTRSDDELAAEAKSGSMHAMVELYERHRGRLMRYIHWTVGDRSVVEDVFHETILYVLEHIGEYEPRGCFGAYLLKIARSKSIDAVRAKSRGPVSIQGSGDGEKSGMAEPVSAEPSPDRELEVCELRDRLGRMLDDLPPEFREVLVLRFYEGLSYREISRITGLNESTLRSRTLYALRLLRASPEAREFAGT